MNSTATTPAIDIRPLPHLPETERAVLQLMLEDDNARAFSATHLDPDDFSAQEHQAAFRFLRDNPRLDFIVIADRDASRAVPAGVLQTLQIAFTAGAMANHFRFYLDCLREARLSRTIYSDSTSIGNQAAAGTEPAGLIATMSERAVALARIKDVAKPQTTTKSELIDIIEECSARAGNKPLNEVSSRWASWTQYLGGISPLLYVIAGPTGSGKSVLATNITLDLCRAGKRVLFVSYEMTSRDVLKRMVCDVGNIISTWIFAHGHITLDNHTRTRLTTATAELAKLRLVISEAFPSVPEIVTLAETMAAEKEGLGGIVIDYLQLAPDPNAPRHESRERRLASMSAELKRLSGTLKIPVIILSQLNEDGKTRESRALEMDAEVILLIREDGVAIQKNRHGESGNVMPLTLKGAYFRFEEDHYATPANR